MPALHRLLLLIKIGQHHDDVGLFLFGDISTVAHKCPLFAGRVLQPYLSSKERIFIMTLKKNTADKLRKIVENDYGVLLTDEQVNEFGGVLLRLTRIALSNSISKKRCLQNELLQNEGARSAVPVTADNREATR